MRTIDLVQGSEQWLTWRKQGVSATDSPVILGKSPYQTPWGLWAQKTGLIQPPDLSRNPNVRRGNRLEPVIRGWMEQYFGDILLPVCAEWDADPVFRASFDGVTSTGLPVELKAPSDKTFEEVKQHQHESTPYKLYFYQVQHQILVSDADYGWLVFFREGETPIAFKILRDRTLIDEMIKKGRDFWTMVQGNGEPPLDPERDVFKPVTADQERNWLDAASIYRAAERTVRQIEAEAKALKKNMKQCEEIMTATMGEFQKADFAGVKVTRFEKAGSIDYKKLLSEKLNVDESVLEAYRRKSSQGIRISSDPDFIGLPQSGSNHNLPYKEDNSGRTDVAVKAWF